MATQGMAAQKEMDKQCINTIRTLAMDAVQQADSGHPDTPLAMAPVIYCLWQRFLNFDPQDPVWPNRDRFVLSMGHASTLLYAILHLCGVKAVNSECQVLSYLSVELDDIKNFRQLDGKCPGHPENRWTSGIETTTDPPGRGVARSVAMALAGRWMGCYFNRTDFDLFNYNVYAMIGDGCMMEALSGEAASFAAHLKLSNLCWIYNNHNITVEGHTALTSTEDVTARFIGFGWNVNRVEDANNLEMLGRAFATFQHTADRPTLIIVDSHLACGAPGKQDTSAAPDEPPGDEEIRQTKKHYGRPEDAQFRVPDAVYKHFKEHIGKRGRELHEKWAATFEDYKSAHPILAQHGELIQGREVPQGWGKNRSPFPGDPKGAAGRAASDQVLNAIAGNFRLTQFYRYQQKNES